MFRKQGSDFSEVKVGIAASVIVIQVGIAAMYSLATGTAWFLFAMQTVVAFIAFVVGGGVHFYKRYIAGIAARRARNRVVELEGYNV